jgi:hypothetical protein
VYEQGAVTRVAYVKTSISEPVFRVDEDGDLFMTIKGWDRKANAPKEEKIFAEDSVEALEIKGIILRRPEITKLTALGYGIDIKDVPLPKDAGTMREGIEPGNSGLREMIVAHIDLLTGLETVPITTLRTDEFTGDVLSVQEGIVNQRNEPPPQGLDAKLIDEIRTKGKEHAGAQSLMRIACLDYLVNTSDRHTNNLLFNPVTQKFQAIDNGFALSLSRAKSDQDPTLEPITPFRSAAMELVQESNDPAWLLDDQATARLTYVYNALQLYLTIQEDLARLPASDRAPLSLKMIRAEKAGEAECIVDLFRLLFKHQRIADAEIKIFKDRLKYLVDHRRPPILPRYSVDDMSGNTLATVWPE